MSLRCILLGGLIGICQVAFCQGLFPLKISKNKRHFETRDGRPFLYHADTGWQLMVKLTEKEAIEYLTQRKNQGFNVIQVQVAMEPDVPNRYGHKPFDGDVDFSRPNQAYHDHILKIIHKADSMGLAIALTQPWLGCCHEAFGNSPDKPIQKNGPKKNRIYGEYLGRKFSSCKNLFWVAGGDNDPKGDKESLLGFIEGLYSTAPSHQLITYHASPPHSSTDLFQYHSWLGFSFIYTYWREKPNAWVTADLQPHVYEAALREYSKSDTLPFVLGESQYEGDGKRKENDMGTPHIIRRQAYWAMLSGAAGHAYGSDMWDFPADWPERIKYPGANQLKHFKRFFDSITWWELIPDLRHQAVISGYGDWSKNNFITTAVSSNKRLLVSYFPQLATIKVDFNYLSGQNFEYYWFDPCTGRNSESFKLSGKDVKVISPATGEDLILVIKSTDR